MASSRYSSDGLARSMLQNAEVRSALGEIVVVTTQDKIKICLMQHLRQMEKRNGWVTPGGLLLTVGLTFLTADFKDRFFPKETWEAIFAIGGVIFLGWLIYAVIVALRARTVEDVLIEIQRSSLPVPVSGPPGT